MAVSQRLVRGVLGTAGVSMAAFGGIRILQHSSITRPAGLVEWLIGSLLVHDLIIGPLTLGAGWLLNAYVPPRARAFVQAGLVAGGLISLLGLVLIWRQGKTSARSLALLQQNYTANLLLLLVLVALAAVAGYLWTGWRGRRAQPRATGSSAN